MQYLSKYAILFYIIFTNLHLHSWRNKYAGQYLIAVFPNRCLLLFHLFGTITPAKLRINCWCHTLVALALKLHFRAEFRTIASMQVHADQSSILWIVSYVDTSAVVGTFFQYWHVDIIWSRRRCACQHNSSFKIEWNTRRKTVKTKVSWVIYTYIIKLTLIPIHFVVIRTLMI